MSSDFCALLRPSACIRPSFVSIPFSSVQFSSVSSVGSVYPRVCSNRCAIRAKNFTDDSGLDVILIFAIDTSSQRVLGPRRRPACEVALPRRPHHSGYWTTRPTRAAAKSDYPASLCTLWAGRSSLERPRKWLRSGQLGCDQQRAAGTAGSA